MSTVPPVAIIILNWNGLSDTLECLESVFKNSYQNYSVYVVDNASERDELSEIKKNCKLDPNTRICPNDPNSVIFIQNKTNLGFAEGNNVGIRRAMQDGAEYIFTLNNDTVVDPGFLTEAINAMCNSVIPTDSSVFTEVEERRNLAFLLHRDKLNTRSLHSSLSKNQFNSVEMTEWPLGIVATTMLQYHDRTRIDSLGHDLLTCGDSIPRARGELHSAFLNAKRSTLNASPLGACAGAALYSVDMLRQIGLFDQNFFLNYEDADLSLRAIVQGWRVVHCSSSIIYHKGSTSINKIRNIAYQIRSQRNQLFAYLHNIPLPVILLNLPAILTRDLLAIFISFLLLQWRVAWILIRSRFEIFLWFPVILKKRRKVLAHQKISSWWIWNNQKSWVLLYFQYFKVRDMLKNIFLRVFRRCAA